MSRFLAVVDGTVRESFAKFTFLAFLAISTIFLMVCLFAVNLDIVGGVLAGARLFGQDVRLGSQMISIDSLVTGIQQGLAGVVFGVGLLLSIFATANLVPVMVEKGSVDLLLSKPISRPALFLGRYAGAITIVTINLLYLVGGVWVLLGWKTGVWSPSFLISGLLISFTYAVLLGFMMLVGVWTRSSTITMILTYALFPASGLLTLHAQISVMLTNPIKAALVEGLYLIVPKIPEIGRLTVALSHGGPLPSLAPLLSSALFGAGSLAIATVYFTRKDY